MGTSERRPTPPPAWLLRVTWIALPLLMGPAVSEALEGWARAPRSTAEVLLWTGWVAGLVGVLAPRPLGLTIVRVASMAGLGTAVASAFEGATLDVAAALAGAALAASLVTLPPVTEWFANGSAYGHEYRFALRHPPVIRLVVGPLSVVAVTTAIAAGPLLLAHGRIVVGTGATLAGMLILAFLPRSLHALSRRWLIAVPGGLVVHDPLTIADPVLVPRHTITSVEIARPHTCDALDLRLGSTGGLHIVITPPVAISVRTRGRAAEAVRAGDILVSPARPGAVLMWAGRPAKAPDDDSG